MKRFVYDITSYKVTNSRHWMNTYEILLKPSHASSTLDRYVEFL